VVILYFSFIEYRFVSIFHYLCPTRRLEQSIVIDKRRRYSLIFFYRISICLCFSFIECGTSIFLYFLLSISNLGHDRLLNGHSIDQEKV